MTTPAEQSTSCPECGAKLRFERDRAGYGRTIELCEHFDAREGRGCKHWRPLEIVRHPAHTTAPTPKPRPIVASRRQYATGYRTKTRQQMRKIYAVLPIEKTAALTVVEVAARAKLERALTERLMRALVADGVVGQVSMPRPGRYGRPFAGYWLLAPASQEAA